MITDVAGVKVGHWTDPVARTGCTVVVLPEATVASGEVRGGAPGTREFELLDPTRTVTQVDAVVFTGGSAFGLAVCDGVVRWLEGSGRGVVTAHGRVPIVVGAVIYDLGVGRADLRPGAEEGMAACGALRADGGVATGLVGAGTGATVGKWRGLQYMRPGGLGCATVRHGDVVVSALMVVNAYGDIVPAGAEPDREHLDALADPPASLGPDGAGRVYGAGSNTTIGLVVTNAMLTKTQCLLMAQSGHNGLARALWPVHTTADGDAVIAASVPGGPAAPVDLVRAMAVLATAAAIRTVG